MSKIKVWAGWIPPKGSLCGSQTAIFVFTWGLPVCASMSKLPLYTRTTETVDETQANDLTLSPRPLYTPCLQIRWHSELLGVRTPTNEFGGTGSTLTSRNSPPTQVNQLSSVSGSSVLFLMFICNAF